MGGVQIRNAFKICKQIALYYYWVLNATYMPILMEQVRAPAPSQPPATSSSLCLSGSDLGGNRAYQAVILRMMYLMKFWSEIEKVPVRHGAAVQLLNSALITNVLLGEGRRSEGQNVGDHRLGDKRGRLHRWRRPPC